MKSWMKYLGVVVGAITVPLLIASVALSVVVEQTGIPGKNVYSYDQATGFARMQVVMNDILVQLGGEHVGATEAEGYLRVSGGIVRVVEAMTDVTTNTTSAVFTIPSGAKTPRAFVVGTGAVTQTFKLYGTMTNAAVVADATLIGTITLSGTTKHEAGMDSGVQFTADYPFYFAVSSVTTGTDATGTFEIHVGTVAAGAAGGGAGDASAANQTTQITALQLLDNIVSGAGANISQINGVAPLMGAGSTGTGSTRTTEANDSQLSAVNGATGDTAAGVGGTGSHAAKLRVMTTQLNTITSRLDTLITAAQLIDDDQTGGTRCVHTTTAATNSTNCKNSAGRIGYIRAINTTGTLAYLRLYNLASAPTCSSATGYIESIPVPASATGAGFTENMAPFGEAYSTGIGFCVTGGGTSTDNTNSVAGVYLKILYK